ncbi:MAG TPA: MarC family protein [Blastocatellia bacterium]|jgi:multiple antibiotic resistance protein|nr:MarC family protein [Blastocatellia bacterium]
MNEELLRFSLTPFVTLLVVVDPPGVVPIFVALTEGADAAKRRATVRRAVLVALVVALFFLVAGRSLLSYLGVTIHAFAISGGVLLFATALPMLFGHRPGARAEGAADGGRGPGDLSASDSAPVRNRRDCDHLAAHLSGERVHRSLRCVSSSGGSCLRVALVTLQLGGRLMARIGEGKLHTVTRVMGIVLAALAVQFILNGITAYYDALTSR